MRDRLMSDRILRDDDEGWNRLPFNVEIGSTEFESISEVLAYRSANFGHQLAGRNGENSKAAASLLGADNANSQGASGEKAAKWFGLEDNTNATLIGKPWFQDTRVGGNEAINCLWQFNRDDDIVHTVLRTADSAGEGVGTGMGRVYAATHQQNQTLCWFTFGVPYFTPLARFYKSAFNTTLIELNNNGWTNRVTGDLGRLFGHTLTLAVAFPLIPIKWFVELSRQNSNNYRIDRFYELRGRMQLYYEYVDGILAHWLVAVGLYGNKASAHQTFGIDRAGLEASVPDALKATGASIWDIVRRRALAAGLVPENNHSRLLQTLADENNTDLDSEYDQMIKNTLFKAPDDVQQFDDVTKSMMETSVQEDNQNGGANSVEQATVADQQVTTDSQPTSTVGGEMEEMFKMDPLDFVAYSEISANRGSVAEELRLENGSGSSGTGGSSSGGETLFESAWNDRSANWLEVFKKSALGATQFVGFRITRDTDSSESFSNSTSPSEFAEDYNSKVRSMQSKKIATGTGGGTINWFAGDDSAIGNFVQSLTQDVISVAQGAMDAIKSVDFTGLTDVNSAVFKGAFIDIPEQYSSSDFNKSHSITLQLRSPYGDLVSIYQSIIVPLACILAGCLPRASGANSYTQPFLCRCYCKGRFSVPMGIFESVSIKRGDSEYGWTYDDLPTAIDVTISIKDMSPIMYMAIAAGGLKSIWGADNAFNEYILTLAGAGLFDRISTLARFMRNIQYDAHILRNRYFNPAYWAHNISATSPVQFIASAIPKTTVSSN